VSMPDHLQRRGAVHPDRVAEVLHQRLDQEAKEANRFAASHGMNSYLQHIGRCYGLAEALVLIEGGASEDELVDAARSRAR
jgi:hypothetical protein